MVFTREDAARAAQTIGIDFKKEAFQLEDLLNGMNTELARHGTKAGTVDVTHDDPHNDGEAGSWQICGYRRLIIPSAWGKAHGNAPLHGE